MQKFILENLDCNSCAMKLERAVCALPSVQQATINFATSTLYVQTSDIAALKAVITSLEPSIIVRTPNENLQKDLSHKKDTIALALMLLSFGLCMFGLHYSPLQESAPIRILNGIFPLDSIALFGDYALTPFLVLIYLMLAGIYITAGLPIFQAVWRNIKKRIFFDENTLMFLATIAAFCIGEVSEAVAVMLFFRIGEFLESLALKRSKQSLYALLDITPEIAHVKQEGKNAESTWQDIHPDLLKVGDIILVKAGEKIPTDSLIISGQSSLNMQSLSGESAPVFVQEGAEVLAGAINIEGALTLRVQKPFCDSQIAQIKDMVEQASSKKAKSEQIITRFAKVYTPIMFAIALAIACIPPLFDDQWREWIYRGLVVLMVSCPCALVLSVPLGYFGALGVASTKGIILKGAEHFANIAKLTHVVFDKTGTLTQGVFEVRDIMPLAPITADELLTIASHAQRFSNHPIARAIMNKAGDRHTCSSQSFQEISGQGVLAVCCESQILVGNEALMQTHNIDMTAFVNALQNMPIQDGVSLVHIAQNGIYQGYITFGDTLKKESKECMQALRKLGVMPFAILSGDTTQSVAHIAQELSIPNFYAKLLPTQKAEKLQEIKQQHKDSVIAFMGDGINDCVVLQYADVGVSIGTESAHSDLSKESADMIISNPSPMGLVHAITIARKIQGITWQNITFALGTKLLLVLLGVAGIANMWLAVFGDVGVALLALLNALRVARV